MIHQHDDKDRNLQKKIKRQKYLEQKLSCNFVRCNLDSKSFNIFAVINEI